MAKEKQEIKEAVKKEHETKKKQKALKKDPKDAQIEELTNLLKKVQADFENYQKRVEKEKKQFTEFANKEFIKSILPLLDSFELALKNTSDKKEFVKGVELIYSQFFSLLEANGVKKIEAKGKKFDPYLHEALMQEKSDKEEETVLEELQTGYMIGEDVLRHTKVKVAKK